jgi:hypothetical protein
MNQQGLWMPAELTEVVELQHDRLDAQAEESDAPRAQLTNKTYPDYSRCRNVLRLCGHSATSVKKLYVEDIDVLFCGRRKSL